MSIVEVNHFEEQLMALLFCYRTEHAKNNQLMRSPLFSGADGKECICFFYITNKNQNTVLKLLEVYCTVVAKTPK